MILATVAVAFLTIALSSCDRKTCPTYSEVQTSEVENKG